MSLNTHRRTLLRAGAALTTVPWLAQGSALAQTTAFPTRPIKLLVGSNPGGPADMLGRTFGDVAAAMLGQPVVENKPGATGTLAAAQTAKSAPDGHTLLVSGPSTVITAPYMYSKLDYEPEKELAPITLLGAGAFVVAVHPALPVNTIAELIALAKAQPGKLSYGSGGAGGNNHICTETFLDRTGIQALHVPYRGEAPAAADLIGGQVQFMFTAPNVIIPHHKAGKLRIIAVTSRERVAALPEIPTVHETVKDFEVLGWIALFAPGGTPVAVQDRLAQAWTQARGQAAIRDKLEGLAMAPPAHLGTRDAVAAMVRAERQRLTQIVKRLNLTAA